MLKDGKLFLQPGLGDDAPGLKPGFPFRLGQPGRRFLTGFSFCGLLDLLRLFSALENDLFGLLPGIGDDSLDDLL